MTSELDSSLTSIDWLPNLGMSSLRSGKERGERKRERGRERDTPPSIPSSSPPPNSSKGKPPHSYATLIAMAISSAPERKLSLNDIYTWISDTFPFYSRAGRGWKVVHPVYTLHITIFYWFLKYAAYIPSILSELLHSDFFSFLFFLNAEFNST